MALFSLTVQNEDTIRRELNIGSPAPAATDTGTGTASAPGAAPAATDAGTASAPGAVPAATDAGTASAPGDVPASTAREASIAAAAADPALAEAAEKNAALVMDANDSPEARLKITNVIEKFGQESMRLAAEKARFLASAGELARAGDGGGSAAKGLGALGAVIRSLDPSGVDFDAKGFMGLFRPAKKYFSRFEQSEDSIADISRSLAQGRNSLKNDNITIRLEQAKVKEASQKLRREIALGLLLDDGVSRRLAPLKDSGTDPDKVSFIENDVLFPLRQRIIDLQQTLVVNDQGIIAMEVVSRNNAELIRGVDRALTVTLATLRTSAAVAGALYNQKITLRKLREFDSAAAAAGAEGSTLSGPGPGGSQATVQRLKDSFRDVMNSLDEIERFKDGALQSMQDSVGRFRTLAESGSAETARIERGQQD
ncbi:MAG: toxic anion resistance protein [Deltaproteobacteria bacterium]|jgi:uncharacterized protein YaaN involved in tellurite resistance|nr:toxic anion resistance protein [Deltaproteobacteria bacterium]